MHQYRKKGGVWINEAAERKGVSLVSYLIISLAMHLLIIYVVVFINI